VLTATFESYERFDFLERLQTLVPPLASVRIVSDASSAQPAVVPSLHRPQRYQLHFAGTLVGGA
jgi:hypothetical protein